jgi:YidC/Oxa1 family membrane protein insertase
VQAIGEFLKPLGDLIQVLFFHPVYNILMIIYEVINRVFPAGAFALAIVILTLIIRSALIPLTRKQLQSTRKMQLIQPELKALQQRYRGDPQTLMAEQRRLYKENGVSMYGGCLPLLVQMPFLYALYGAFLNVIHHTKNPLGLNETLYPFVPHLTTFPQTQFFWTNLISPDPWHILPIIAAALTFIQLRMAMPVRKPRLPGENPDPTTQATATTQYIMPLVTLFIGWTFPSGLALYWCISTAFSAVQQYFINGNWGSLFVGVPGMEHLVPPPKDLTPTVTRTPTMGAGATARALTPTTGASGGAPEEGGLRGWWQRMKESMSAAQTQAMERAEQVRQEREESLAQSRQRATGSDASTTKNAPQTVRRQRPSREAPMLVKPAQPATSGTDSGDDVDAVIREATDKSVLPEQQIAKGSTSSTGSTGSRTVNGANKASGTTGSNGTRPATSGGSNAARKNPAKGGSGARPRNNGRPKGGR